MPTQTEFDLLWMDFAFRIAKMSKDPSTQVGAVIVRDNRHISTGWNGMPPGVPEPEWVWQRPIKYHGVIHAEINALRNATFDTRGTVIYSTHQPCPNCLGTLISYGIHEVVYSRPYDRMTDEQRDVWNHIVEGSPIIVRQTPSGV